MDIKMSKKAIANFKNELIERADEFAEDFVEDAEGCGDKYSLILYVDREDGSIRYNSGLGTSFGMPVSLHDGLRNGIYSMVFSVTFDDFTYGPRSGWDLYFIEERCSGQMLELINESDMGINMDVDELKKLIDNLDDEQLKNELKQELIKLEKECKEVRKTEEKEKQDRIEGYSSMFKEIAEKFDGESDMQEIVDSYNI